MNDKIIREIMMPVARATEIARRVVGAATAAGYWHSYKCTSHNVLLLLGALRPGANVYLATMNGQPEVVAFFPPEGWEAP